MVYEFIYDEFIDPKDFQIYRKEAESFIRKIEEIAKKIEQ